MKQFLISYFISEEANLGGMPIKEQTIYCTNKAEAVKLAELEKKELDKVDKRDTIIYDIWEVEE